MAAWSEVKAPLLALARRVRNLDHEPRRLWRSWVGLVNHNVPGAARVGGLACAAHVGTCLAASCFRGKSLPFDDASRSGIGQWFELASLGASASREQRGRRPFLSDGSRPLPATPCLHCRCDGWGVFLRCKWISISGCRASSSSTCPAPGDAERDAVQFRLRGRTCDQAIWSSSWSMDGGQNVGGYKKEGLRLPATLARMRWKAGIMTLPGVGASVPGSPKVGERPRICHVAAKAARVRSGLRASNRDCGPREDPEGYASSAQTGLEAPGGLGRLRDGSRNPADPRRG